MTTPTPGPFEPVEIPSRYAKAIIATLSGVAIAFQTALTDNKVTVDDLASVGIALLTAVAVWWIPEVPARFRTHAKAAVAFLGTGLQALVPFLVFGQVTYAQWLTVGIAALGALLVGVVPNAPTQTPRVINATGETHLHFEGAGGATITPTSTPKEG